MRRQVTQSTTVNFNMKMTAAAVAALCFWAPACAYQIDPPPETELITFEELDPGEAHLEPFDLEVPGSDIRYRIDGVTGSIHRIEGDAEPTLAWRPTFDSGALVHDEAYEAYRAQAAIDFRAPQLAEVSAEGLTAARFEVERLLSEGFNERALIPSGSAALVPGEEGSIQPIWNPVGSLLGLDEWSDCELAASAFYGNLLVTGLMIVEACLVVIAAGLAVWSNLGAMASAAQAAGQISRATQLNLIRFQLWQARNAATVVVGLLQTRIMTLFSAAGAWLAATSTNTSAAAINSSRAALAAAITSMVTIRGTLIVAFNLLKNKILAGIAAGAAWASYAWTSSFIVEGIDFIETDYLMMVDLCSATPAPPTPGACGLRNHSINACSFADSSDHVHQNSLQNACRASLAASTHPDKDADDHIYCVADCVALSTTTLILHPGSSDYWECGAGHVDLAESDPDTSDDSGAADYDVDSGESDSETPDGWGAAEDEEI